MKTCSRLVVLSFILAAACAGEPAGPAADYAPAALLATATATVDNNADSGPGSFRAAVEAANADASIGRIAFASGIGTIDLQDAIVYTGSQPLHIDGGGAILDGAGGAFDADGFVSNGGANLVVTDLTIRNASGNGMRVDLTASAPEQVRITLRRVELSANGRSGLYVDDQAGGFGDGADSFASIVLEIRGTSILDNGYRADITDFDGVRVDEGGDGNIRVYVAESVITGNAGDGLELDEIGRGNVWLDIDRSSFDGNGSQPQDPSDLEDGFDIDEAGPGSIYVTVQDVTANDNFDEGVDLDELDEGSIVVKFTRLEASRNADEGIKLTEDEVGPSSGGIDYVLRLVTASDNGGDGIQFEEFGEGNVRGRIVASTVTGNDDGIDFEQEDPGIGTLLLINLTASGNSDEDVEVDGVTVTEHAGG